MNSPVRCVLCVVIHGSCHWLYLGLPIDGTKTQVKNTIKADSKTKGLTLHGLQTLNILISSSAKVAPDGLNNIDHQRATLTSDLALSNMDYI